MTTGLDRDPPRAGVPAPAGLRRIRTLALLLDSALRIPGTRIRVGLDPLLGLVPGLGDALTVGLAGYIVVEAGRLGASSAVLLRMLLNVGFDALVGSVPFLGDFADVFLRANTRNLRLLERHLEDPTRHRRASLWFLVLILIGLVVAVGGTLMLGIWAGWRLLGWLGS